MEKSIALSCDFMRNLQVRMLKNRMGIAALIIIVSMLCRYDEKTKCIPRSEKNIFLVAEDSNNSEGYVRSVLDAAIALNIFKAVYINEADDRGLPVTWEGLIPNKELCTGLWNK